MSEAVPGGPTIRLDEAHPSFVERRSNLSVPLQISALGQGCLGPGGGNTMARRPICRQYAGRRAAKPISGGGLVVTLHVPADIHSRPWREVGSASREASRKARSLPPSREPCESGLELIDDDSPVFAEHQRLLVQLA